MRSGNLNFTLPLLRAQGRGGSGIGVSLTYNSQNWRQDGTNVWKHGYDAGYGFGWRALICSVFPVYQDASTVHHFVFTDATGAEYKLDTTAVAGVWTGKENYVTYDANNVTVRFNDGTSIQMGTVSADTEPDAGTRYGTVWKDTNGNYVEIFYQPGYSAPAGHTSARIDGIKEVRGGTSFAYNFTYDGVWPRPHLTGITNILGTGENYTFNYTTLALDDPFGDTASYGTVKLLSSVVVNTLNTQHSFEYGTNSAGELTKVIFPQGGELRWSYRDFTYQSSKKQREMASRSLVLTSGATALNYTLTRDDAGDAGRSIHRYTRVLDPSGVGEKKFWFETSTSSLYFGLATTTEGIHTPSSTVLARDALTWTTDGVGRPYVSSSP